jgi:hypothetical protein
VVLPGYKKCNKHTGCLKLYNCQWNASSSSSSVAVAVNLAARRMMAHLTRMGIRNREGGREEGEEDHNKSIPHPPIYFFKSHLILSSHLCLDLPTSPFVSRIFDVNFVRTSLVLHVPHAPNNIQRRVQIMKLLIIHFSLFSRHCFLLRPKCHSQHPVVIKFPQSVYFRKQQRPSFTP